MNSKRKVLIAPLDWGLGHATRCVPIINAFLQQGFEVLIAGENAVAVLLQKEFPTLQILPLAGYNVQYNKNKSSFVWKILAQIPGIIRSIKNENAWLQNIIDTHKIDIVLSDNRFGLHSKKVKTIFITHQLQIQTGNSFLNKIVQGINYKYINKFDFCWVPEVVGENNLAAALSHPNVLPKTPVRYIGILSRLQKNTTEKNIDVAVLLSGPEPQRSIFENIIIEQIENSTLKIVLARGLPNEKVNIFSQNKNVQIVNHLPSNEIGPLLQSAKIVVARSGYSTVMDLAAMQQAAILVPTPGQTEQEYLAKYLSDKKYCIATTQEGFDLHAEIENLKNVHLEPYPVNNTELLEAAIGAL
jgi:predicted glycosyltransferase